MICVNGDIKLKRIAFCYAMEVVAIIEKDLNTTFKKNDQEYWNNWNKSNCHCKNYKVKYLKTTAKGAFYMHQKYIYID